MRILLGLSLYALALCLSYLSHVLISQQICNCFPRYISVSSEHYYELKPSKSVGSRTSAFFKHLTASRLSGPIDWMMPRIFDMGCRIECNL
ncbi:hypothetical protein V8F33_002368 [Rhypophila sp. PSN 637]